MVPERICRLASLAFEGKAMTKPVPLNEYDVKCALLKVKGIFAEEASVWPLCPS